mmetsp:Transcript_8726/g.13166  ORF Transcript_8726/g.13166 Transcript_8726/m.13166 type:complete len:87 (+) Transcript_8726:67-327(+)
MFSGSSSSDVRANIQVIPAPIIICFSEDEWFRWIMMTLGAADIAPLSLRTTCSLRSHWSVRTKSKHVNKSSLHPSSPTHDGFVVTL